MHVLPEDTYLVGLTLPQGSYVVQTNVNIFGDNNGDSNTQCALWTATNEVKNRFLSTPGSDTAVFSGNNRDDQYFASLMSTVTLTGTENQILAFCSAGGGPDSNHATVVGQMIATLVDAID